MNEKIMVVDDEPGIQTLMTDVLSAQGYGVINAGGGRRALQDFERFRPELVLLDVRMPDMDGFEVCRRLKSNAETRLTPVVLLTALSATEDRIRGIEAGADDFLTKPFDRQQLLARVDALLNLKAFTDELDQAESVIFALARSIEGKDPYTVGHCERLSGLAERLGRRIGLPEEQINALRRGGIVHDVGKVVVPDAILLKPGRLTSEEWEVIRRHPVMGEQICKPLKSFRLVAPIIRHHHEKLDASGYPDGLKGGEIPLTARVMSIVDVYDALTTPRPYKSTLSTSDAMEVMAGEVSRGWWDPELFGEFMGMLAHGDAQTPRIQ